MANDTEDTYRPQSPDLSSLAFMDDIPSPPPLYRPRSPLLPPSFAPAAEPTYTQFPSPFYPTQNQYNTFPARRANPAALHSFQAAPQSPQRQAPQQLPSAHFQTYPRQRQPRHQSQSQFQDPYVSSPYFAAPHFASDPTAQSALASGAGDQHDQHSMGRATRGSKAAAAAQIAAQTADMDVDEDAYGEDADPGPVQAQLQAQAQSQAAPDHDNNHNDKDNNDGNNDSHGLGPSRGIDIKTKFPVARIKRIMQADEEVGKVAQVTPVAVSKALELFMISLVTKSSEVAKSKSSKRITAAHLKSAIESDEQFDFLGEIVSKVAEQPEASSGRKGAGVKSEDDSDDAASAPKRRGKGRRKKSEG